MDRLNHRTSRVGYGLTLAIIAATALGMSFFSVTALVSPGNLVPGGDAEPARVYAAYMAARNLPLVAALIGLLIAGARRPLAYFVGLTAAIQALDMVIGVVRQQAAQAIGPAVFAIALTWCSWWLFRHEAGEEQKSVA